MIKDVFIHPLKASIKVYKWYYKTNIKMVHMHK